MVKASHSGSKYEFIKRLQDLFGKKREAEFMGYVKESYPSKIYELLLDERVKAHPHGVYFKIRPDFVVRVKASQGEALLIGEVYTSSRAFLDDAVGTRGLRSTKTPKYSHYKKIFPILVGIVEPESLGFARMWMDIVAAVDYYDHPKSVQDRMVGVYTFSQDNLSLVRMTTSFRTYCEANIPELLKPSRSL